MNTYRNRIFNPFRMNTYEKTGGGGTPIADPLGLSCLPRLPSTKGALLFTPAASGRGAHSFTLFAEHGNSSSYFSIASALFAQTRSTENAASLLFSTSCGLFQKQWRGGGMPYSLLLHSLAERGNSSSYFSTACALFLVPKDSLRERETLGCTPILLYPESLSGGAILERAYFFAS